MNEKRLFRIMTITNIGGDDAMQVRIHDLHRRERRYTTYLGSPTSRRLMTVANNSNRRENGRNLSIEIDGPFKIVLTRLLVQDEQ